MRIFPLVLVPLGLLWLPISTLAQTLDGIWESQGYGNVYAIHGDTLNAFEVTTRTCVEAYRAKRANIAVPGVEAVFKSRKDGVLLLSAGNGEEQKVLSRPDSLGSVRVNRLAALPAVCDVPTANTPQGNFDVFAITFAEHYIAFDLRDQDWEKAAAQSRAKVTPRTSPAQLFAIFDAMLKPLGDLHTYIEAPGLKRQAGEAFRPGTDGVVSGGVKYFATKGRQKLFAITNEAYLGGRPEMFCNGQLQYGLVDDYTGYLRILSFGDYSKKGKDIEALEAALDTIFSDDELEALIIDVRLAFGGDDRLGLAIASRLANTDYLAFAIQARAHPVERDKWTPAEPVIVRPSARPAFRGPVVELIGPITMSAAETFTQALMGRSPHVTRIGDNTQGVFCDVMGRRLPNHWMFGLPNAVYRSGEGRAYDVQGIPPDIRVPVFDPEDVAAGRDRAMAAALDVLDRKGPMIKASMRYSSQ